MVFGLFSTAGVALAGPLGGGETSESSGGLTNPLEPAGIDSIPLLIDKILEIVVKVGLPIVAIAIIYTGFLFVSARGDPSKLTTAKDAFKYTIIGAAIVLGAAVISAAINATVDEIRSDATVLINIFSNIV
ncbi:MAG: hypothetical protein U9M92_02315 [Patescibacteria group bacterium]|nr:hypothetical protein [Patescibacteria group bacterium]